MRSSTTVGEMLGLASYGHAPLLGRRQLGVPGEQPLEVGQHVLERPGPELILIELHADGEEVVTEAYPVVLDPIRWRAERGRRGRARVGHERADALQEHGEGRVEARAAEDAPELEGAGAMEIVQVARVVGERNLGEASHRVEHVPREAELVQGREGVHEERGVPEARVDLRPVHGGVREPPEAQAVDGAEGAGEPNVEHVVEHARGFKALELPAAVGEDLGLGEVLVGGALVLQLRGVDRPPVLVRGGVRLGELRGEACALLVNLVLRAEDALQLALQLLLLGLHLCDLRA
mmetsp:Transcript_14562/g.49305  ORF Transcript_14562/g.49305 Transcript_14562/m.49305 type:complete len:292 (+) Transcript_14562:238-1113(+)